MSKSARTWTRATLERLPDADFQIVWFATFGGPPAMMLPRPEMVSILVACIGPEFRIEGGQEALVSRTPASN